MTNYLSLPGLIGAKSLAHHYTSIAFNLPLYTLGFPTDMQSQMMSYLSIAKGMSIVVETVFESRNKHISELIRMGAEIIQSQDGMTSLIKGVDMLKGTTVVGKDLRGGAALILAGMAAEGETIVTNSKFVERGYEKIEDMLTSIGGNVRLVLEDEI